MVRTLCWLCTSSTTNNRKIDGGWSYGGILTKSQDVEEEIWSCPDDSCPSRSDQKPERLQGGDARGPKRVCFCE